jgi:hypothetical protein
VTPVDQHPHGRSRTRRGSTSRDVPTRQVTPAIIRTLVPASRCSSDPPTQRPSALNNLKDLKDLNNPTFAPTDGSPLAEQQPALGLVGLRVTIRVVTADRLRGIVRGPGHLPIRLKGTTMTRGLPDLLRHDDSHVVPEFASSGTLPAGQGPDGRRPRPDAGAQSAARPAALPCLSPQDRAPQLGGAR